MLTNTKISPISLKLGLLLVVALVASVVPVGAQPSVTGIYMCAKVEIAGKIGRCLAPSIELKSDGSYQILAERGNYEVIAGRWLVLSESKNHAKARLDGSREIIFEFTSGGKKSRITYRRKFQRTPGSVAV